MQYRDTQLTESPAASRSHRVNGPDRRSHQTAMRRLRHATRPIIEAMEARTLLAGFPDSIGTEFWVAFEPNKNVYAKKILFLSAEQASNVTIDVPGLSWTQAFAVTPGLVTEVQLPDTAFAVGTDQVSNIGIHITSDQEIAVHGLNNEDMSADGFTALPVDVLGQSYMTMGYATTLAHPEWPSQFAVVATQDGTTVTITPRVDAGTHLAGVPFDVPLNQGQVYQLQAFNLDLTGSLVTSDKPVAVFSGDVRTSVPFGYGPSTDHLVEQLTPVTSWGTYFVTIPFGGRLNGDTFRVLASEDGTEVRINGVLTATLSAGQFYEWIAPASQVVICTKPSQLAQYANNTLYDNQPGDQFMLLIPPARNVLQSYTMATPATWNGVSYINLWASNGTQVYLDGTLIPTSSWVPFGNGGYVGLNQQIPPGSHTITGSAPVGVVFYGWDSSYAYGYLGGISMRWATTPVTNIDFETPNVETVLPNSQVVGVIARDAEGLPIPGLRVDFTVTGANSASDYGITDVNGRATFTYAGAAFGLDTVVATSGTVTQTGTVLWHTLPVVAGQNLIVAYDTPTTGVVVATNADGHVPACSPVALPAHGTLLLNPDGTFTYTPFTGYFGDDSFTFVATDSVAISNIGTVSLTVTPLNHLPVIPDQTLPLPENRPINSPVGTVQASDPDGDVLTYAITAGNSAGLFAISASTGLITLAQSAVIDFEAGLPDYVLTVQVTDNGNPILSAQATITIHVTNVNERATDLSLTGNTIAENQPAGTAVGALGTSDPDAGDTFTYSLVGGNGSADNASFAIVGNQLRSAVRFDFETRSSYSIRVRTTDAGGLWLEKVFALTVTDVNDAPTDLSLSSASIVETTPVGTVVGSLSSSDQDSADTFSYALVAGTGATDNASFTIAGNQLATATNFDFKTRSSYSIRVRTTDAGGLSFEKVLVISITRDQTIPVATLISAPNLSWRDLDKTFTQVTVRFHDVNLDPASITGDEITVTGPAGTLVVTLAGKTVVDAQTIDATYRVSPAAGSWTGAADGTYTITAPAGAFADTSGNPNVPTDLGAFTAAVSMQNAQTVFVNGTAGADAISVTLQGLYYCVALNGAETWYPGNQVSGINVRGFAGNDTITIGAETMGVTIDGGTGDDSITGGDGNDLIRGDAGNDTIIGGLGDDTIMGNSESDVLVGGGGADCLMGGLGADTLDGGLAGDTLLGGDGRDSILGGDGDDWIEGRGKMDTIYAGAGNDTIYGGAGSDLIYGEDGDDQIDVGVSTAFHDTVDGGAGSDLVCSDADDVLTNCEGVWPV